jgi:hypothetical protein
MVEVEGLHKEHHWNAKKTDKDQELLQSLLILSCANEGRAVNDSSVEEHVDHLHND